MALNLARQATKQARPILSTNRDEARRNVIRLYKAWHPQLLRIRTMGETEVLGKKLSKAPYESKATPVQSYSTITSGTFHSTIATRKLLTAEHSTTSANTTNKPPATTHHNSKVGTEKSGFKISKEATSSTAETTVDSTTEETTTECTTIETTTESTTFETTTESTTLETTVESTTQETTTESTTPDTTVETTTDETTIKATTTDSTVAVTAKIKPTSEPRLKTTLYITSGGTGNTSATKTWQKYLSQTTPKPTHLLKVNKNSTPSSTSSHEEPKKGPENYNKENAAEVKFPSPSANPDMTTPPNNSKTSVNVSIDIDIDVNFRSSVGNTSNVSDDYTLSEQNTTESPKDREKRYEKKRVVASVVLIVLVSLSAACAVLFVLMPSKSEVGIRKYQHRPDQVALIPSRNRCRPRFYDASLYMGH